MKTTLLKNASLVLADEVCAHGYAVVQDGVIAQVGTGECAPAQAQADSAEIIDLRGFTLWPGFIDIHIHGAIGVDVMTASARDLRVLARHLAQCGVTAWLPTLVPAAQVEYEHAIVAIDELHSAGSDADSSTNSAARVLGVHYEGPFVSASLCGALRSRYFRTFDSATQVDQLPRLTAPDARHLTTVAPDIAGGIDLIKYLRAQNWIVALGHTRADKEILDEAAAAGALHLTHMMNAMAPLHQRRPGPVGWGLLNDAVTCDVIADGIHLDDTALGIILRCKSPERMLLISDAIPAAGLGDGKYEFWDETIEVNSGRTSNAQGSIAGSVITMHDAVLRMLLLGVPAPQVSMMASRNPARLLKLDHLLGSIACGQRADLVALDQQGAIRMVMIGGLVAGQ